MTSRFRTALISAVLGLALSSLVWAQPQPPQGKGPPGGGPGGVFIAGPMGQHRKVVKQFDKDGDGRLNKEERQAAREFLKKDRENGRGGFGPRGPGPRGNDAPPKPGPHVDPTDVNTYPDSSLYEPTILRTLFLEFEDADWEAELADFYHTDVEVPATLTVDGKKYPNVGVHFRGASSFFGVPAGSKRSLNVEMDFTDSKQRLYGHKTLNLLNSHDDPSMMSSVLYSHIARQHIPAPKANFAKVVINGESWGVYVNVQQFNKEMIAENFKSSKGARWKVKGSPGGGGGLDYIGDNADDYRGRYEIKSGDDQKSWKALIHLCKTLNDTPADQLEAVLKPILDIDSLLWFLALDVTLINCDGYWIRASDYSLFKDDKGVFHVLPHDMNECFRTPMGPGMGGAMMFSMGQPGEVLPGPVQDTLKLSAEQKKQVKELQTDVDGKLEKILTPDQRAQLKNLRSGNPGAVNIVGGFGLPMGSPGGPGGRPGGPGGGRGGPGGPGGMPRVNGVELDPLVGLDDAHKPLRSKILAVPALKERYLRHVRTLAEESLDWKKLGPVVAQYRALIEKEVEADTRKLDSFAEFQNLTADTVSAERAAPRRGPPQMSLRAFADQRRKYLLDLPAVKPPGAERSGD
jgi:spore coat protein CotH